MGVGVGDGARKATGERGKGRGRVEEEGGSEGLHNISTSDYCKVCFRCNFLLQISPPTTRGFSLL